MGPAPAERPALSRGSGVAALTAAALACFAGNSLLCRAALGSRLIGPEAFTATRILAGAATLLLLQTLRGGRREGGSWLAAGSLLAYAALFSYAYLHIDAGVGALLLFGTVQATLLARGIRGGHVPSRGEWLGLATALGGLALLTLPGKDAPDALGSLLMAGAGVAWASYTWEGRGQRDALGATAMNFARAACLLPSSPSPSFSACSGPTRSRPRPPKAFGSRSPPGP